jgi:murein DD-endopeptidase MepM/ murein hydrolase activator NlpD
VGPPRWRIAPRLAQRRPVTPAAATRSATSHPRVQRTYYLHAIVPDDLNRHRPDWGRAAGAVLMAAPIVVGAVASNAARSATLRWLLLVLVASPVLAIVLLLVLLGGGAPAGASSGGAGLRPGAVPAAYLPALLRAAQTCPAITAPLLAAQLDAESGWNPRALSPTGAGGLAQFMPGTWASEGLDGDGDGIRDPFDPADAIASQASFMCRLLAAVTADAHLIGDPIDLALAAYNAGLGAVRRYHGIPPYPETRGYIHRIRTLLISYAIPDAAVPAGAGTGTWVRPLTAMPPITSGYGQRGPEFHAGVDFPVPIDTPVYAASSGTVLAAGPANGFGQWVKLGHPGGITTVYGHISSWTVTVGQAVHAGQLIARSGNDGHSTGPHLHFEVRPNDQPADPVAFYAAQGIHL